MTSARHIMILFTAILTLIYSGSVIAKPLTPAEHTICKNLNHCLGIVKRHPPQSYDYTLLSQEFLRFGEKGHNALLDRVASRKNETIRRTLILLKHPDFRFSPGDQQRIANQWRSSPSPYLTPLMTRLYSPIMREAFISTLSHDDITIRRLSRHNLEIGEARLRKFQSKNLKAISRPSQDNTIYIALVRAIFDAPTPTLLSLLEAYPVSKTQILFTRLLETNDPDVMIAAYEALHRQNKDLAPQILYRRLKILKNASQNQHIGNVHALLILQNHVKKHASLSLNFPAMERHEIVTFTRTHLIDIWYYLKTKNTQSKVAFIELLTQFPLSADIETIISDAFSERRDYRITLAAINNIGFYKVKAASKSLEIFAQEHPIRDVRLAALNAIDMIQERPVNIVARAKEVQKGLTYCPIKLTNFETQSRQLPYFDEYINEEGLPFRRVDLSSAAPVSTGWLAAYSPLKTPGGLKTQGGLVYFDNKTGTSELLHEEMTLLITPTLQPKLGKTAKQFWVVSHNNNSQRKETSLQSLIMGDEGFSMKLQAMLPSKAIGFSRQSDDSIIMTFAPDAGSPFKNTAHPPLRLFPNGNMVLSCQSPQKRG